MLGALVTLLFVVGAAGLGWSLFKRLLAPLDPAAQIGIGGLLALGLLGTLMLFVGLVPGLLPAMWIPLVAGIAGLYLGYRAWRPELKPRLPEGPYRLIPAILALLSGFVLVSVIAPSDVSDWDTLAYHLAVPKLWTEAGRMFSVPGIHHSNFPFAVDNLYVWGLQWGGESGAKAFQLGYYLLGMVALFGLARQRYGGNAGWWAALVFATVPVIIWEAGTAYIDVANGLYGGLGILFAARLLERETDDDGAERRGALLLSALLLGLAAGSKYTGLQTIFTTCTVLLLGMVLTRRPAQGIRLAVLLGVAAMVVAAPWYARNQLWTGNPVFPFFYERLGGANWDQQRADIYRNEQQTFGIGRTDSGRDPLQVGHAILGLAYQPGRYVNPGQEAGMGSPLGATGVAVVGCLIVWLAAGRLRKFEAGVVGIVLLSLLMWFFLSQQSRYIVPLAVPLAVLAGGAIRRLGAPGKAMAMVAGIQALVTIMIVMNFRVTQQLPVVLGTVAPDEYRRAVVPFYEPSRDINRRLDATSKLAMYDEVFGVFLDVPYMWANPGHSTLIPYDEMQTGDDYTRAMRDLGFTHAYVSLSSIVKEREFARRWIGEMGLGEGDGFPQEERAALLENWETRWHVLLADAVREGRARPVQTYRSGLLIEILP
jgi:hypothetical protein